jgi:DNA-binding transcriptional MerR regulator
MDISEVAKRSGLPASTLRYYEEKHLIKSIGRHGLKRVYDDSVLDRLALISLGRHSGFSLDEIALMFAEGKPRIDRTQLTNKAEELDRKIKHLEAMRDGLRHAAQCTAPNHFECRTFQRLLGIAGKRPQRSSRSLR